MKPVNDSGRELDAAFAIEPAAFGVYLIVESRGGSDGGPRAARNADYAQGLETLLSRSGTQGATLLAVEVFSRPVRRLPEAERKLTVSEFPFPLNLASLSQSDVPKFRTSLGRASAKFGQAPEQSGGNSTKKLRLSLEWPAAVGRPSSEIEALLARPQRNAAAASESSRTLTYEPLGKFLRAQTASEITLPLLKIATILGHGLPKEAHTHQFWANTRDHHPTRRGQWLNAGYKAFYLPGDSSVAFRRDREAILAAVALKDALPTADRGELEQRAASAQRRLATLKPEDLQTPPEGNMHPQRAIGSTTVFVRDPRVVAWVRNFARAKCEACEAPAPFLGTDGLPFLEVHHMRPLAAGGPDKVENAIAICPNCHRRLHHGQDRDRFRGAILKRIDRLVDYPEVTAELVEEIG